MKRPAGPVPILACRAFWLVAALGLLFPAAAVAQPPQIPFGEDTHAFRRILHDLKLTPLTTLAEAEADPQHTIIICLGGQFDRVHQVHLKFLQEGGGSVLVATDRAGADYLGYRVAGTLEVAPQNLAAAAYRGVYPYCPLVQPVDGADPDLLHDLHRGVATNKPGYLVPQWKDLPLAVLATFPKGCQVSQDVPPVNRFLMPRQPLPGQPTFAVGGELGKGRVVFLSDHSVFINDMMLQPDNDNFEFTYNCLEWLKDGDEPKTKVLYLEDSTIRGDFNIRLRDVPAPDLVSWTNKLLSDLEGEDIFTQMLLDKFSPYSLLRGLAILSTLVLLGYGWLRLLRSRHRFELGMPLFAKALARMIPAGAIMEQRHQAMLAAGNLYEAARERARQCFEPVFAGLPDIAPSPAGAVQITVIGGWWRRRSLTRRVRRLWQLAFGRTPLRVSPREFSRLVDELGQVKAALADGTLRLDEPNRTRTNA